MFAKVNPFNTPHIYLPLEKYSLCCTWVSACLSTPKTKHKDMSPSPFSPHDLLYDKPTSCYPAIQGSLMPKCVYSWDYTYCFMKE